MHSLSLHASTIASLQPALSPRLQRAVRLLQMSSQDFAQVVRDALDTNPFLEQEEVPPGNDADTAAGEPGLPLSDVEIARQLSRQGLQVARRTVTKYRQLLRIEPAQRRCGRFAGTGEEG